MIWLRFVARVVCAVGLMSLRIVSAQQATFEVVPPAWITPDGVAKHPGEKDPTGTASRAFVFPSIGQRGVAKEPTIPTLANFFARHNHFHSDTFVWQAPDTSRIVLTVTRNQNDAKITLSADSESAIRRLTWDDFGRLQVGFVKWLFDHTNCGFFVKCESRYGSDFRHDLITVWKAVLDQATFDLFAAEHLNLSRWTNCELTRNPTDASKIPLCSAHEIEYSGSVPNIQGVVNRTRMFATLLAPGQHLRVTWGNDNYYPSQNAGSEYSRITSGGSSDLHIVWDRGMRIGPKGTCKMTPAFQQGGPPVNSVLLPIPVEWSPLVNTEFVPIYSVFDLENSVLLSTAGLAADCTGNAPAPKFLFLLTPSSYLKADPGGPVANVAQFENEARAALYIAQTPGTAREDLLMLARQFLLVGCDSSDPKMVEAEWNHLLETGFNLLGHTGTVSRRTCGLYVNALFTGKSSIQIRNSYSIDGRIVEDGARDLETIGQVFADGFASRLNLEGAPTSKPLLEVFRVPDTLVRENIGSTTIRLRFHTTVKGTIDQIYVSEGDEIRANSVQEGLR